MTPPAAAPLLQAENVVKHFPGRRGVLGHRADGRVRAVDGVNLTVRPGETVGLVGETGSGKSTLARCITRLYDLTAGRIVFDGTDISRLSRRRLRPVRRQLQMIFQDPYGSLNPHRRVGSIIADPYAIHGVARRRRAPASGSGADAAGRAEPRALQPLPGGVLRRPATARRHRPGARAASEAACL